MLNFVKEIDVSKFDILFYVDIFSMAFGKFVCSTTRLNVWDYVDLGYFNKI